MSRRFIGLLACLLTAILGLSCSGQAALASPDGGTVTSLSAAYNASAGMVQISGTAVGLAKGIVVVEVHTPGGALLYFGTATANQDGSFATSIDVGALGDGTYRVRSADYIGGTYEVAEFIVVETEPPTPPSDEGGSAPSQTNPVELLSSSDVVTSVTSVTATVDANGNATMIVSRTQMSRAVSAALEEASKTGVTAVAVDIIGQADAGIDSSTVVIPKQSVDLVASSSLEKLTVSTPVASMSFGQEALNTISGASTQEVSVVAALIDNENLSGEARAAVGERPVFRFTVTSGNTTISDFAGAVEISVPYTLRPEEDPDAIVIYFINAEGEPEVVRDCVYDPSAGRVAFITDHFSVYAVGYNKITFSDVPKEAWYSRAIGFIAARDISNGVGNSSFAPMGHLTRAQTLVMTMRTYGISPLEDQAGNFADAGDTYYTGYLAAAKQLGISDGVGNNLFEPDKEVTSQELFVMLYRTLAIIDRLPTGDSGKTLSSFEDASAFASWAQDATEALVSAGIIQGDQGRLGPMEPATRARMAEILFKLLGN